MESTCCEIKRRLHNYLNILGNYIDRYICLLVYTKRSIIMKWIIWLKVQAKPEYQPSPPPQWCAFAGSLHILWISKTNKVYKCLAIGINRKDATSYLLVAERTYTLTGDLHNRFPLFIQFIFYLFHDLSLFRVQNLQ